MIHNIESMTKAERISLKIQNAIRDINLGLYKKVEIEDNILIYKVPTQNENKYTIRLDIKVDKTNIYQ